MNKVEGSWKWWQINPKQHGLVHPTMPSLALPETPALLSQKHVVPDPTLVERNSKPFFWPLASGP